MPCCQNLSDTAANLSESSWQLPQKLNILWNNLAVNWVLEVIKSGYDKVTIWNNISKIAHIQVPVGITLYFSKNTFRGQVRKNHVG